jgi:integrase
MITTTKDKKTGVILARVAGELINTGTTDRAEAKRLLRIAAQMSPAMARAGHGPRRKVAEAIDEWGKRLFSRGRPRTTVQNKLTFIHAWARDQKLLTCDISEVTEKHVDAWVNAKDGTKAGTRRVRLSILHKFMEFCLDHGYCVIDPSRQVDINYRLLTHEQKETSERECFTPEEIKKLNAYLDQQIAAHSNTLLGLALNHLRRDDYEHTINRLTFWRIAVGIGLHTGLRMGDIAQLEWACLKKPGKIAVWTDKRDRRVELTITPELAKALAMVQKNNSPYLFPVQQQIINPDDGHRNRLLSVQFGRILTAAGIEGRSFHCLRHTYITDCHNKGIELDHIRVSVGHSTTRMTEGYIH